MSNLTHYSGSSVTGGVSRQQGRAITRSVGGLEVHKAVGLARIETAAQLEAAKVHAAGYIGQQAMQAVTMVSQLEGQLGTMVPLAVTRLQGIADITAVTIAGIVMDAGRRLG